MVCLHSERGIEERTFLGSNEIGLFDRRAFGGRVLIAVFFFLFVIKTLIIYNSLAFLLDVDDERKSVELKKQMSINVSK